MEQAEGFISNVTFCDDTYSCAEGASALVIVTEWEQFRALDFGRLKSVMARPVLVDLRNIYQADEMARHGFVYEIVGRRDSTICMPNIISPSLTSPPPYAQYTASPCPVISSRRRA